VKSHRGSKHVRHTEGTCADIIDLLRATQDNDSIAVDVFRNEYRIVDMPYDEEERLLGKSYREIIQYFTLEGSEKYYCRSKSMKRIPFTPVLLVD
jgi:hypothetical protein